jgi:hypothetical protein
MLNIVFGCFCVSHVDLLRVAGEVNTVWGEVSAVESCRRRTQRYFAFCFFFLSGIHALRFDFFTES